MDNLEQLAKRIARLEREIEQGINISENEEEIEEIMLSISFTDLLQLNELIEKNIS